MSWKVTGIGADTGAEYVYRVDAPADTQPVSVEMSAAHEHGRRLRAGEVPEYLRPPIVATWEPGDVSRETIKGA